MKNYLKLEFPALSENETFARGAVAAFCLRLNPSLDELSDVKTAVSEAVTNCIVHAYAGKEGIIRIECEAEGDTLHIEISDSGRGIEDVARAVEPFFTTLEDEERSGMGFTIMQTFMSTFKVESAAGRGTTVTMTKRFGAARGAAERDGLADAQCRTDRPRHPRGEGGRRRGKGGAPFQ